MINIAIDTNVLLAALIAPSGSNMAAPRRIASNMETFQVFFSSQIFDEYSDVLPRPIVTCKGLDAEARLLLHAIRTIGKEVVPESIRHIICPDRKDRPILEAAVYVDGTLLTNNLKDFPFFGVSVIAPEEFLDWCNARGIV